MANKNIIRLVAMAFALASAALTAGCSEDITGPSSLPPLMNRPTMAEAQYILIPVEAIVTSVSDSTSLLAGAVSVGDTVRGFCLYDETAEDEDSKPDKGKYLFDTGPCSMDFETRGLRFRSDPNAPALAIRLANDDSANGQNDSAHFISTRNLDVLPGVAVQELHIMMIDRSCNALSCDALLGTNPFMAEWPAKKQLTIAGAAGWSITAELTAPADEEQADPEESSNGTTKLHICEQ